MVEKNARICDVCDKTVAEGRCDICAKDICQDCTEEIGLNFFSESSSARALLFNVNTCERCRKQFSKVCLSEQTIFEDVFKDKPELKNEIVEAIKNIMMLKKISDEEEPKKEEESYLPPRRKIPFLPKKYPYPRPYPNPFLPKPYDKYYIKTRTATELPSSSSKLKKSWFKK